jgi:hypothetical protein
MLRITLEFDGIPQTDFIEQAGYIQEEIAAQLEGYKPRYKFGAVKDAQSGLISCAFLQVDTALALGGYQSAFQCISPDRKTEFCLAAWHRGTCPCKDEILL